MAWKLTGEMVESCSCNMLCPCWYAVQDLMVMDRGWCGSPWLLRVESGESEGTEIPPLVVALGLFFPGPTLFDGNATARVYYDESTDADTRSLLEPILQGQRGGPPEIVAGLVSEWLPSSVTPITVEANNGTVIADVGTVGHIHSQRLVNDLGDRMTMSNAGFAVALGFDNAMGELAPSEGTRWSDPDFPEPFECKSGVVGQFAWGD